MNFRNRQILKKILTCLSCCELTRKRQIVFYNNLMHLLDKFISGDNYKENVDLFDYQHIIAPKYFRCCEWYRANALYGIGNAIRLYSRYNNPIKACIEHGVYFGKSQNPVESTRSGLPAVICFSPIRKKYLREITCKPIIAIGPYIHYAESYCNKDEIGKYKNKFGKILLVFPSHSVPGVTTVFDVNSFICKIESFKSQYNFNTVIVCLYFRDIEMQRNIKYEEQGYIVTCAGRREDPLFLSRQKAMISLSDYTISNAVGTHIGYSIALGVPHMLIDQRTDYRIDSEEAKAEIAEMDFETEINKSEVKKEFLEYTDHITEGQRQVCEKYWGLSKLRTPEQLLEILKKCEAIFRDSNKKEKAFDKYASMYFDVDGEELS